MFSFNEDSDNDSSFEDMPNPDATDVMDTIMSSLWEMFIEPREETLSDQEKSFVHLVGITLKLMAHKAQCYDNLEDGESPEVVHMGKIKITENDILRN